MRILKLLVWIGDVLLVVLVGWILLEALTGSSARMTVGEFLKSDVRIEVETE